MFARTTFKNINDVPLKFILAAMFTDIITGSRMEKGKAVSVVLERSS